MELDAARRAGDLARMSELQYGRIPELEKRAGRPPQQAPRRDQAAAQQGHR
jgi:ATP-dependent Clp protease ATP-binding subunit ClpB